MGWGIDHETAFMFAFLMYVEMDHIAVFMVSDLFIQLYGFHLVYNAV